MTRSWLLGALASASALLAAISIGHLPVVHGEESKALTTDHIRFFNEQVRPVLAQNCYKCHTTEAMGGLKLDSRPNVLKGGESGAVVVPGDPDKSLLIQAVRQTGDLKMPPEGPKLNDSDVAKLVQWVQDGVAWDTNEAAKPVLASLTPAQAKGGAGDEFFENKIRPIFATQCGTCHQDRAAGGLSLSSRESIVKGAGSGPAIVPGDPDKSLLMQAVLQTGPLKMPKGGKLSAEDTEALAQWIRMGAPWPENIKPVRLPGKQITPEMRRFACCQPLQLSTAPAVKQTGWAKTDIDRFVLAKLEQKGLTPAPRADRRPLISRGT